MTVQDGADGALVVEAEPDEISQVALRAGVALNELRAAEDGGSLEELFFRLTADQERPPNGSSSSRDDSLNFTRKDYR
jgi:ABC-2 type transport system ATP-binding protein